MCVELVEESGREDRGLAPNAANPLREFLALSVCLEGGRPGSPTGPVLETTEVPWPG